MIILDGNEFDIRKIAESGQCFRMKNLGQEPGGSERWLVIAADRILEAEAKSEELRLECSQQEYDAFWSDYFDARTDYAAIRANGQEVVFKNWDNRI